MTNFIALLVISPRRIAIHWHFLCCISESRSRYAILTTTSIVFFVGLPRIQRLECPWRIYARWCLHRWLVIPGIPLRWLIRKYVPKVSSNSWLWGSCLISTASFGLIYYGPRLPARSQARPPRIPVMVINIHPTLDIFATEVSLFEQRNQLCSPLVRCQYFVRKHLPKRRAFQTSWTDDNFAGVDEWFCNLAPFQCYC